MADEKITIDELRAMLSARVPVPHDTNTLGWAVIDMHRVLNQLLTVVEQQEAQINALEERPTVSTYPKVYKDQNGEFRVLLVDGRTPTFDEFKSENT